MRVSKGYWDHDVVGLIRKGCDGVWGSISGALPNKSNSKRQFRAGRGPNARIFFAKSKEALQFESNFTRIAKACFSGPPMEGELTAVVTVTPKDMRRDLDAELLFDCIEKAGIIKNDRQLWQKVITRLKASKENPGVRWLIRYSDCSEREALDLDAKGPR